MSELVGNPKDRFSHDGGGIPKTGFLMTGGGGDILNCGTVLSKCTFINILGANAKKIYL